jgi:succinylglutamic semialdehyde dehydrogenase
MISYNPATNQAIWTGQAATKSEVDQAVEAAKMAKWARLSLEERLGYIDAFENILKSRSAELAKVISEETGKPLWESKSEVSGMAAKIAISKEAYGKRCEEMSREVGPSRLSTRFKPIGTLAVFGPFNFPGHLPNGHIIPALIAGNTIVFKPSELTPLVGETMIRYWNECRLPQGVINLVQGGAATGRLLAEHPKIDGLLFTGSYKTGLILAKQFGNTPEKILALEMGGNNPLVLGNVSDLKTAACLALQSAYISAGQRCTCARRLIIPSGAVGNRFLEIFIQQVKGISVGPYTQSPEPFMGPVIDKKAAEHLLKKQQELIARGAKPLIEMRCENSPFLTPGLIDVTDMQREDEEIFGPLLQVIRVKDFEAALEEANRTAYGLVAGLFSDEHTQYEQFYQTIRAGVINWNTPTTGASSLAPFGGTGHSGNHRPSAYYAADYCSYPVTSLESPTLQLPPGFKEGACMK